MKIITRICIFIASPIIGMIAGVSTTWCVAAAAISGEIETIIEKEMS